MWVTAYDIGGGGGVADIVVKVDESTGGGTDE